MARAITLQRSAALHENFKYLGAYRLRVDVSDATDMDARVFLYERGPVDPYTQLPQDYFVGVCSPVDIAEFPADEPGLTDTPAFFRLSYFELDLRSTGEAEELWGEVQRQVCVLVEALDRLEALEVIETITCPGLPEVPSDSSVSSTSSTSSDSSSSSA